MNLGELFFSWHGGIARMRYFLASLTLAAASILLAVLITAIIAVVAVGTNSAELPVSNLHTALVLLPSCGLFLYSGTVLMIKRLHDIGLSGFHVLWIYGLGIMGSAFNNPSDGALFIVGFILSIVQLFAGLWLLLMPGQSSNYTHAFE